MTTNFPTDLDDFVNPQPTDMQNVVSHAGQHQNINDAVKALQEKVGKDNSSDTATLDYILKNPNSVDPGHTHTYIDPTTENVSEGATNKYFTDARAVTAIADNIDPSSNVTVAEVAGKLVFTSSALGSTDDLDEGTTNKYFTDGRVFDSILNNTHADTAVEMVDLRYLGDGEVIFNIVNGKVTTTKLADSAVINTKIANGAVVTEKIAYEAVSADKLAPGSVTTAKLASGSVTTDKLANDSVTAAKLAPWALAWTNRNITGDYTLALSDDHVQIRCNITAPNTVTIPPIADVPLENGTEILVIASGSGSNYTTIAAGAGVTIWTNTPLTSTARYSTFSLRKVSNNIWSVNQYGRTGSTVGEAVFTAASQAAARAAIGADLVIKQQIFTASGTYTPDPNMLGYFAECVGGGGGGGLGNGFGSGGGAGGYSSRSGGKLTSPLAVTIGAGGAAGIVGTPLGGTGGTTTLAGLISATGGTGGNSSSAVGGTGGAGSLGTINLAGGDGGGVGQCYGGASQLSGSARMNINSGTASAGKAYGGGGAGGNNGNVSGGVGASGVVIVTEYCSA